MKDAAADDDCSRGLQKNSSCLSSAPPLLLNMLLMRVYFMPLLIIIHTM